MDPRDYITPDFLKVDTGRMSALSQATSQLATTDPFAGLRSALSMGDVAHSLLTPQTVFKSVHLPTADYASSAVTSLSLLRGATDALQASTALANFPATVGALSIGSQLGESLGSISLKDMRALEAPSLPSFLPDASFRIGVADALDRISVATDPYFASAKALYALESKYSVVSSRAPTTISIKDFLPVVSPPYLRSLHESIHSLSAASSSFVEALRVDERYLSRMPTDLIRAPGIELYTATQLTASVSLLSPSTIDCDEDIEEAIATVIDEFEDRLAGLNGGLVTMYRGGSEAIERGGTDWQRHALTSFRELLTHVLHLLAPDNEVFAMATGDDLHNGRPTRRARLRFIFRAQSGPEIARFFEADLKAALELFDLLNNGTHRLDSHATREQAHYLRGRVSGLVSSMLAAQGY